MIFIRYWTDAGLYRVGFPTYQYYRYEGWIDTKLKKDLHSFASYSFCKVTRRLPYTKTFISL